MTTYQKELALAELDKLMQEWNLSRRDTLIEFLCEFYENEFAYEDNIYEILCSNTDDQLMSDYLNINDYDIFDYE